MSIKNKLIGLLFAFCVAPAILFGLFVFSHERTSLSEVRLAQLNSVADLKKDKIETFFREREGDLTSALNFTIIRRYMPVLSLRVRERGHPDLQRAQRDLDRQINEYRKSFNYPNVVIADSAGTVVYSADTAYGAQHLGKPYPDAVLLHEARKGVYFTDLARDESATRIEIMAAGPVLNDSGNFIGYVIIQIDMVPIFAFIADPTGLGRTGESLIVQRKGDSVLFLSPLRYAQGAALKKSVAFNGKKAFPAQKAAQGDTGAGKTIDYAGDEVLAAWRYLPSLRWGLVSKINTDEALQPVFDLRRHIIIADIVIFAVGSFFAFFFAARLTDPIRRLQKGAELIRGGDLDHRVSTSSKDEIGQLSRAFDDMTVTLKKTIDQHRLSEEEVRRLNEALRLYVAQLESSNSELEAFAYSVSHDLRSPLRSIEGFSLALLEDYSDKLDSAGKDYLSRVRNAAVRMGQLIDDLLKLSRVTRSEMTRERTDLSMIARSIADNLKKQHPERTAQFIIADGLTAYCDTRLITVVMENMLANAWKFSEKSLRTVIEFGTAEKNGERAFFVSDNGAGFDMQYAGKLFSPFQRLHRTDDFPGTGIGLATVKRIINRHGGKVWIEAEEGKGATVYFTLM